MFLYAFNSLPFGYDYQADLSKHQSQTDASKGFGGKFGVQKDNKDKVNTLVKLLAGPHPPFALVFISFSLPWDTIIRPTCRSTSHRQMLLKALEESLEFKGKQKTR